MKLLSITALLLLCSPVFSQNCSDYFFLQNNKTIEMTISNNKGKESGKMIYVVSNGSKSGNSAAATVNSEFIDAKGQSITKASNNVKCESGVMMMDMTMFIPAGQQQQMKGSATASNVYLEYPAAMKEGDMLKDGIFSMDYESAAGMKSAIEVSITDRKVIGKESVTTPAGNWECFKISTKNKITSRIAGIGIPIRMDVTEWYAPGFGVVKTESKSGKTEITSIK
jgi:hypothetical protein